MTLIIEILILLFVGVSVGLLTWSLFRFPVSRELPEHRRLLEALGTGARKTIYEQKTIAPLMSLMLMIARRLNIPRLRQSIQFNLDASGNPNGYSIEEYLAICLFSGVGMASGSAVLLFLLGARGGIIVGAFLLAIVGFVLPLWALMDSASRRLARIGKQLPYTLDLIALIMEAGATFTESVETIIRDNPQDDLNQELRFVYAEIDYGTTRAAALSNLARRISLESLRSVVGAINQAEALGTPLSAILKAQSGTMRMHRGVRAEKLAASASLRILIPSMLILIAVVLLVLGPLLIRMIESSRSGSGFSPF